MIRRIERIAGVFIIYRFGLKTVILTKKTQQFNFAAHWHRQQKKFKIQLKEVLGACVLRIRLSFSSPDGG